MILQTMCVWLLLVSKIVYATHEDFTDTSIQSHFATKTTYAHRISIENSLPWIQANIPTHLRPVLIDATLRHGTRFPSVKLMKIFKVAGVKYQKIIEKSIDLKLSNSARNSILRWKNQFEEHSNYLLSSLGWNEQITLGFKYFLMMPELWHKVLAKHGSQNQRDLMIMTSSKVRVLATAKAFLNAIRLANNNGTSNSNHQSIQYKEEKVLSENNQKDEHDSIRYANISVRIEDGLLRFFDQCQKYVHTVNKNETAEHEFQSYFKSKQMNEVLDDISGIEDRKELYHIYQLCAFEMAIYGNSVWCQLFNNKDIPVLEYASDLKHYYKTGHGYAVNVEQSCILLQNITDRIAQRVPGKMQATLRFGHAETLIPLVSLLEFYQEDRHLKAHNFDAHKNRTFRTGKISPFSGNLAIVLYESVQDKNVFISFTLNENIIRPFGLDCYFCDFNKDSVVYKKLHEKLEDCHKVCDLEHERYIKSNIKEEL
uniref:multiple inositol polyphosphate phosphatase 1-like n=1 Tax=Styela clava TaxID=7725 RepID=UPI001939DF6F|nr:multiple inositol polyphosphate phosphatase 1-like [Styela clava]